tara:strand:- start:232 stop:639 length:408 start_codon:yes stop_codon:yes gene_type:complete
MKKIFRLFIFLALISSGQSFAGYDGYICTILQIQKLDSSGKFVKETAWEFALGKQFTIDRDTGKIIGKGLSNELYSKIKVLQRGDEKDSYKHIATNLSSAHVQVQYVYVREYAEGLEKPFWATDDNYRIYSGLCE